MRRGGGGGGMTLTAGGFVVFLLYVPVTQGQNEWGVTYSSTQICALKGSTVNISCTYNRDAVAAVEKEMWFTRDSYYEPVDLRSLPEYSGRVQHRCVDSSCTLTLTDLKESDSAEYKFRFTTNRPGGKYTGQPGVTLSVQDLQVQVLKTHRRGWVVELKCLSGCQLPENSSYIWFKNGLKVHEGASYYSSDYDPGDSFSCALKGREDFPSPPQCVSGQYCNSVTYPAGRVCAFKGFSVDITCTYNSYRRITSTLWFSPGRQDQWQSPSQPQDLLEDPQYAGRVEVVKGWGTHSTLRIRDLRESDSAEYRFRFTTENFEWRSVLPATTLTVTDPDLQVLVADSDSIVLYCHSGCRLPFELSYVWFKNGQKIQKKEQIYYYSDSFHPADSYSCALKGFEDFPSPPVCARGQTCRRVMYADRSVCASRGSSVDISCTYHSYTQDVESTSWFSPVHRWEGPSQPEDPMKDSQHEGRVQVLQAERGRSTLWISDLRESDSTEYRFKFKTRGFEWRSGFPGTTLTVTALKVEVRSRAASQFHTEAELICCNSCGPAERHSFVWFKNGEKATKEQLSSYRDQFYPGDVISCALKGHETHGSPPIYVLKVPSVAASPAADITEGAAVTLTCTTNADSAALYTWFKRSQTFRSDGPQLVFSSVRPSDSGDYYCTAETPLGRRTSEDIFIDVKYAPKTSSVSASPSGEIMEGASVNLTCSSDAHPAANYTWYKNNQTVGQGPEDVHHFPSIGSEDRASYRCTSENQYGQLDSQSVFLDVQYAPKLPSVSVSPSAEVTEGGSVNLTCSSDAHPAANYTWYKEEEDSAAASGPTFIITDFRAEHSGSYSCEAQNTRGRHNSTVQQIVVAEGWKSGAGGTTTAVFLAVTLVSVFMVIRRKRALKQLSGPRETPENIYERRPDDLHYADVHFWKNDSDAIYANAGPAAALPRQQDESVQYAAIELNRGHAAAT